jgi:hypothetical protein
MNRFSRFIPALVLALFLPFAACDSNEPDPIDGAGEEEVITLVRLTLVAPASTVTADAVFDEAGVLQSIEPLVLTVGTTYDVSVDLQNTAVTPAESITAEIRDEEPEAHRFFYVPEGDTADALTVSGLDTDPNGDPLGLTFDLAVSAGSEGESGTFRVKLRHYEEDANLPADKQNDTAAAPDVPGVVETDVDVVFPVSIDD